MAPSEELAVIVRARAGDGSAFERLYRAHVGRVQAVVAGRTKCRDDVEDLVQVVFIRAYEGLHRFRGEAAFSTWLTRIAMNVCASHYEAQCVREKWAWAEEAMGPGWAEDPEALALARECKTIVQEGIGRLPAPCREAMWLRHVEARSYAEIERAMAVPMGTVKTWLHRGRALLLVAFEAEGMTM